MFATYYKKIMKFEDNTNTDPNNNMDNANTNVSNGAVVMI